MNTKFRVGLALTALLCGVGTFLWFGTGKVRQGRKNVAITIQAFANGRKLPLTKYGSRLEGIANAPGQSFGGSAPLDDELLPGKTYTETIDIRELVDLNQARKGAEIYVAVSRYGVTSDSIAIKIIPQVYDPHDPAIAKAIRTGKFQGEEL